MAFASSRPWSRSPDPEGRLIHAEVRIGDSVVMITEESSDALPAQSPQSLSGVASAIMATYWEDVDAVRRRALAAGAEIIYQLADQFYGERGGRLRDPFGQQSMLSQRTEDLSVEEMAKRAERFFSSSD